MAFQDAVDPGPDPQGVMDSLLRKFQPDAQQGTATDPQSTINRLLRKTQPYWGDTTPPESLKPKQPDQPQQPADFDSFGQDVDPQSNPELFNPPDLSSFGEDVTPENTKELQPPPGEVAGAVKTFGKAAAESAVSTAGETMAGASVLAERRTGFQPYYDSYKNWDKLTEAQRLDTRRKIQADDHLGIADKAQIQDALTQRESGQPAQTAEEFGGPMPGEAPLYKAGEAVTKFGQSLGPDEFARKAHPIAAGFGGAVGAAAPIIAGAAVGSALGVPEIATVFAVSGQMGLASAASAFDRGIHDGATPEQAAKAAGMSAIVGTAAGALPIGVFLKPVAPAMMGTAAAILTKAAAEGITFASVAEAQEYLAGEIAKHFYDPEVAKKEEYHDDVSRTIGNLLGGALLGAGGAVAERAMHRETPPPVSDTTFEDFIARARAGRPADETPADRGAAWREEIDEFLRQRAAREQAANPAPPGTPGLTGPPGATAGTTPPPPHPGPETPPPGGTPPPRGGPQQQQEPERNSPEWWQQEVNKAPKGARMNINGRDYVSDGSGWQQPAGAAPGETQAGPRETPGPDLSKIPPDDLSILRRAGHTDEDIAYMAQDPIDLEGAITEAIDSGITPEEPKQGTSKAPAEDIQTAGGAVNQNATAAQAEAGNVQLGHYAWKGGLPVTIEAPAGGVRQFVGPDGKPGGTTMGAAYGRFPGLPKAKDGQAPDVYVGNNPNAQMAYVVDEIDPLTKQYRQSKSLIDFNNGHAALAAYLNTSSKTSDMVGGITALPVQQFVEEAKAGALSHPMSPMMRGVDGVYGFTTARGSTYALRADGTTTRNKAPGHADGGVGPQNTSERTVYMTPQDGQRMGHPQGPAWRVIDHHNGTMSLATLNKDTGKWGISADQKNVPYSLTPEVGKVPLELWGKGKVYGRDAYEKKHLGTAITAIESARSAGGEAQGQGAAAPVQGPSETPSQDVEGGEGVGPHEAGPEQVKAVEAALESVGENPAELPHNIAQTAAEILAEEHGVPPELSYPLAFIRVMYERGLISRETVEGAFRGKADQVEIVLGPGLESQRGVPAETRGAATGGEVEPRPGEGVPSGEEAGEQGREEGEGAGAGEGAERAEGAPAPGHEHGAEHGLRAEHPAEAGGAEREPDHEQPATGVREPAAEHVDEATGKPAVDADQSGPAEGRERKLARAAERLAAAGKRIAEPRSLTEFIAAEGGLKYDPELKALGFERDQRIKIGGLREFRNIFRDAGMTMDELVENMQRAGYLPKPEEGQPPDASLHNQIREMLDRELRHGEKIRPIGEEGATREEQERAEDEARSRAHEDLANELKSQDYPIEKAHQADLDRAVELILKGATPEDAWERATLQGAEDDGDITREETGLSEETPFDLAPEDRPSSAGGAGAGVGPVRDGEEAGKPAKPSDFDIARAGTWWNEQLSTKPRGEISSPLGIKRSASDSWHRFTAEEQERMTPYILRRLEEKPPEAPDERDEFDKAFDAAIEAERQKEAAEQAAAAAKPKVARAPRAPNSEPRPRAPRPDKSAKEAGVDAAKKIAQAADDAMAGLVKMFSDPNMLGMGLPFSDETYARARPMFEQAALKFKDAFHDITLVVSKMVSQMKQAFKMSIETLERMRPYLRKFVEEVRAGIIRLGEPHVTPEETPGERKPTGPAGGLGEEGEPPTEQDGRNGQPPGTDRDEQVAGPPTGDVSDTGEAGGVEAPGPRPSGEIPAGGTGIPSSGDADVGRAGAGGSGVATERPGDRPPEPSLRPNYHIVDPEALVGGGPKARFARNKAAIQAFRLITEEDRDPTPQELDDMASYIGWGSFGQQLFQGTWERGKPQKGWEEENTWLRGYLGKDEWNSANNSIINAHYTDPPTVMTMWQAARQMGFDGGRVLEPSMGIGNFFGMMPRNVMHNSQLTGIELDKLTGGMAKILYPHANVRIMGYQDSKAPDHFYDLIIGNWPFGQTAPADRRYNALNPSLHNYFFAKAIDQVRPGGIVMGITSSFTMDQVGKPVRIYLAKRAELLGAFRLPSGAFEKYAGTSVVTDLIVLKKRENPLSSAEGAGWLESVERDVPGGTVRVNEYWAAHPDHVLGELAFGDKTTFGRPGMVVHRPADFADRLAALPSKLPADGYGKITRGNEPRFESNNTADRQGAVTNKGDKLYVVKGDHLAPLEDIYNYKTGSKGAIANKEAQLHALIGMRRAYGALLDAEREGEEHVPDLRKALQKQYLDFNKAHGQIIKSEGFKILKKVEDPFAAVLTSLETPQGSPAKILFESTIRGKKKLEAPTVRDAFVLQRNQSTKLDLDHIAEAAGKTKDEVVKELEGADAIYRLPGGAYEVADVFLSGNVRRKLREAVAAKEAGDHLMEKPIEVLKKVVPPDVPYYKIEAKFGTPWVPEQDYRQFIADLLGVNLNATLADNPKAIRVGFRAARWKVRLSDAMVTRPEATNQWGHPEVPFNKLLQSALSNVPVRVMGWDADGNPYLKQKETDEANDKIAKIREEFSAWAWRDADRRVRLEHAYNDTMNAIGDPVFDGSFLEFPGMALQRGDSPFDMRKHQVDATWRGIVNRSGLYAHEVGTGKTYTMGAIAVESRRYGIARKPMILAHNANSASVAAEIQEQYPGAKILYIDNMAGGGREEKPPEPLKEGEIRKPPTAAELEKAKEKEAKKKANKESLEVMMNRIANDDWDAIVVPHSLIDRFALTERTLNGIMSEQIAALEQEAIQAAHDEAQGANLSVADMDDPEEMKKLRSPTAKQLVNQRNKIKESIRKMAQRASREGAMSFEDMGIDMILIDEAHEFKKPPITTAMKFRGLNTDVSDRSIALRFLTDYIKSINNGRGVHIFTGTPITNTLTEIFHMQRYVMDDVMKQDGVSDFDAWFNTFADTGTDVELTSTGSYEPVTRLSSFVNVAELRQMLGQFMDIVFADDMPEFNPRETPSGKNMMSPDLTPEERNYLENGMAENPIGRPYKHVVNDIGPLSDIQQSVLALLADRAQQFKDMGGNDRRLAMRAGDLRIPIIVDNQAASAALDQRLYDRTLPAHPEGKVARAVKNILAEYKASDKASQVVFVDQGYNDTSERTARDAAGNALRNLEGKPIKERVPVHNLVKGLIDELVAGGIPRNEIAIVDGSVSKQKRKQIADGMNNRTLRVVIGNRQALGVGVNMQRYLRAMHHLDAPWMPGVLEQANGRGWRQGNLWNTVKEYRYITEGLDGRRWQVLAVKDRFIKSFLKADKSVRTIEGDAVDDTDKETISDIVDTMSAAAGDPRVLIKKKLEAQVEKLQRRERLHTYGVQDALEKANALRSQISSAERWVLNLDADSSRFKKSLEAGFNAKIGGEQFVDKQAADDKLASMVTNLKKGEKLPLGSVYGFRIKADWSAAWNDTPEYDLVGEAGEFIIRPTIASIEGVLRGIPGRIARAQEDITDKRGSITRLEEAAKEPFGQAKLLSDRRKQLADLEADMAKSPAVPPSWLRTGAPVDTQIYAREGEQLGQHVVTGHRWGEDNWYVQTDKGEIPYLDVLDENGMRVFEPRPFEKPVKEKTTNAPPPPRPRQGRRRLSVALNTPRVAIPDALKQEIESEIARMTGGRVRASFEQNIPLTEERKAGLAAHGLEDLPEGSTIGGEVEYGRTLGESILRVAAEGENPLGTTYHELDHLAERFLFTPEENEIRRRETPRMREWLRDHGVDPDPLDDAEVRAETTRVYIENLDKGLTGPDFGRGLHMVVRRMLNHLWTMIRRIRNTLFERGGEQWQDIIKRFHSGDMAGRPAREYTAEEAAALPERQLGVWTPHDKAWELAGKAVSKGWDKVYDSLERRFGAGKMYRAGQKAIEAKANLQDYSERQRRLQNDLDAIERRWVSPDGAIPDSAQFYTLKRLFPGKRDAGIYQLERQHINPIDKHLRRNDIDIKDAGDYLWAKHAMERNVQVASLYEDPHPFFRAGHDTTVVGGSGLSAQQADRMVRAYENGPKGNAYRQLSSMVREMVAYGRQLMVDYGLESADRVAEWARKSPNYVDLSGWDDPDKQPDDFAPKNYTGGDVKGGVKPALGRSSKAANPLINTMRGIYRTIDRGEKNRVFLAAAEKFMRLPRPVRKQFVEMNRGRMTRQIDRDTGLVVMRPDRGDAFRPEAVHYRSNGRSQYFVFQDHPSYGSGARIADVFKRWSPKQLWGAIQWMNWIENKAKSMWTHYNPDFIVVRHQLRYWVEGATNAWEMAEGGTYHPLKYMMDSAPWAGNATRAILKRMKGLPGGPPGSEGERLGQMWDRMFAAGGASSIRHMRDFDQIMDQLRIKMSDMGRSYTNPLRGWREATELMNHFTGVWDNAQRLARFIQEVDNGKSDQEAAIEARDATVDYNLRGYWSNLIGFINAMSNVAVQTGARLAGGMVRNKYLRRVWSSALVTGFGAAAWNYMMGGNDEDGIPFIEKVPEWVRSNNLVLMIPWITDEKGRPAVWKQPMPFGLAWPVNWGHNIGTIMMGKDKGADIASSMLGSMFSAFTTWFEPGARPWNLRFWVPEIFKPAYDVAVNKQWWGGGSIHPDPMFQKRPNAYTEKKNFNPQPLDPAWPAIAQFLNGASGGSPNHSGIFDLYPDDIHHIAGMILSSPEKAINEVIDTGTAAGKAITGAKTEGFNPRNLFLGQVLYGNDYDMADAVRRAKVKDAIKHPWLGQP